MSDLIPIEKVSATELFAGDKLDKLLDAIKLAANADKPDLKTAAGRKAIASRARAVARSKTTIDNAGKDLVSGWKQKASAVDAERKRSREYLDKLRDAVRKPLTDWEAEQKRIAEEKAQAEQARIEAEAEAQRIEAEKREAEIRAREQAVAKAEAEAKAKADAERAETERLEREARHAREVEESAERERLAAIEREAAAKKQAEKDAKAAAAKAAQAAKDAADKAEKDKARAVREAEDRVRREAVEKAEREAAEQAAKDAKIRKSSEDLELRRGVNAAAVKAFTAEGVKPAVAKQVVMLIAAGSVPQISINYITKD